MYEDPILRLARDPNLNKEKDKTSELIQIIHGFPLTERRISKLCQLSLTILQSLEKIELKLKNWQFLSLDINSESHFNEEFNSNVKKFNNDIASKVLQSCQDFQIKLHRISQDLDHITRSLRSLTPMEYLLDSGTLLTQLTLRNIKLKDDLADKITVAYLRAKLINIGTDLELMLEDDNSCDQTVLTYKHFVVSLLKQLNTSIEEEDLAAKYECLAVISDMEKMFDAFKMEKLQEAAEYAAQEAYMAAEEEALRMTAEAEAKLSSPMKLQLNWEQKLGEEVAANHVQLLDYPFVESTESPGSPGYKYEDEEYDSDMGNNSLYSTFQSQQLPPPKIHSITRNSQHLSPPLSQGTGRRDSITSLNTSTLLHKTTISDEMPYLMSAFDLARNFEEDVTHYTREENEDSNNNKSSASTASLLRNILRSRLAGTLSSKSSSASSPTININTSKTPTHQASLPHFPNHKANLPDSALYSESSILRNAQLQSPSSYLYANNSLLAKLGIKPQVITTDLPTRGHGIAMGNNTSANRGLMAQSFNGQLLGKENKKRVKTEEEKKLSRSLPNIQATAKTTPLTLANLASLDYDVE